MCLSSRVPLDCVASTSVDFSAFLRHFAFWPRQIKASTKKKGRSGEGEGRRGKKRKCLPANATSLKNAHLALKVG